MEDLDLESSADAIGVGAELRAGGSNADTPLQDRTARLERLARLREKLSRTAQPQEAESLLEMSVATLGPYGTDAEFLAIFAQMEAEVSRCLLAARVADYPDEISAVARLRALVDCGPLEEAQSALKQALTRFSYSSDIADLDLAIREKAAKVRGLLERGEDSLKLGDIEGAGRCFSQAFDLLPFDSSLRSQVLDVLQWHARSAAEKDWRTSEAILRLANAVQPNDPAPSDIVAAIERAKARQETGAIEVGAAPSDEASVLEPEVMGASASASSGRPGFPPPPWPPTADAFIPPTMTEEAMMGVIDVGRQPAVPFIVRAAAVLALSILLFLIVRFTPLVFDKRQQAMEIPDVVAGTLSIHSNVPGVGVFINQRKYKLGEASVAADIELAPDRYEIRAEHDGYSDFGPVSAEIRAGASTEVRLQMEPKPAVLAILKAEPGTLVTVDNHLLGEVPKDGNLLSELSTGRHFIKLSRDGFLPKVLWRTLGPGEAATLVGSEVALESTDARIVAKQLDAKPPAAKANPGALKDLISTLPPALRADVPTLEVQQTAWQKVDKKDLNALQDFVAKYPEGPYAAQAQEQIRTLRQANTAQAENTTPPVKPAESAPETTRAAVAPAPVPDLDRRPAVPDSQSAEQSAWLALRTDDKQSLENYLAKYPSGSHRDDAKKALANIAATEVSSAESAAILDVIQRFAKAWNAKDLKSITAIQRDLDQRTLKAQLAPVKSVAMTISPVMAPQINGTQATVVCRRQANETFSDGSARQNPASIVTYVLSKRDGVWGIEHSQ